MDKYRAFVDLPFAGSNGDFPAIALSDRRRDFLAKGVGGNPIFLLHDSSSATYFPVISLENISAQFHSTCRVTTKSGTLDDQFAVLSCAPSVPELYELFVQCVAAAIERLPVVAETDKLEACVRQLLDLFRALGRPGNRELTGLWAELFVIFSSRNATQALRAWRADPFERFDFSPLGRNLEVKASIKEQRIHEFALEQLEAPTDDRGFVASLLLQAMSGGLGIMDLARSIDEATDGEPQLRQKLWENVTAALGHDFSERLDRRFDPAYAERHLVVFAMRDVPAPVKPTDARVTAIRFRVDLSSVESSLDGVAGDILARVFSSTERESPR